MPKKGWKNSDEYRRILGFPKRTPSLRILVSALEKALPEVIAGVVWKVGGGEVGWSINGWALEGDGQESADNQPMPRGDHNKLFSDGGKCIFLRQRELPASYQRDKKSEKSELSSNVCFMGACNLSYDLIN